MRACSETGSVILNEVKNLYPDWHLRLMGAEMLREKMLSMTRRAPVSALAHAREGMVFSQ